MIYLDNAATTFPKPEEVYLAMDKANREMGVNAGRGAYRLAKDASKLIAETKNLIRELVHANMSASVVFSSSVTIALNQIINGIDWKCGSVVYVSPYEHNAVARTIYKVAEEKKLHIRQLPIKEETYEIDLEKVVYEFSKENPAAVFCTHVSNVTGYILPVKEIFLEAKKYRSITVLDSAQSMGLIDIDVRQLEVDMIAFAGHKTLYGPMGIGGFINVSNICMREYITGGTGSDSLNLSMPDGNEAKYEAASTNISAIAGLNAAIKVLDIEEHRKYEKELTDYLVDELAKNKYIRMYLPKDRSQHIGIVSFVHKGMTSEDVGIILDEDYDIAVRTGYHCAPWIHGILKNEKTLGTVRIGLGKYNTKKEIDYLVEKLQEITEG